MQLRDWEMLARASLGVVNHLDWFLGSVGRIVASANWASVDLSPEKSADARNLLTAAGTAMLHLAQVSVVYVSFDIYYVFLIMTLEEL